MSSWQLNPTLQPPRHPIVAFIWEAHVTAGDAYSFLECPKGRTLALSWFLLNLLPLLAKGFAEDVSEKEPFRLLGRRLGSCASAIASTLHVIIQNTCDNEKKKDKQNTKFKAAHRRKADDPSTGLLGTGYASDPLNGGHLLFTLEQIFLALFPSVLFHRTKVLFKKKKKTTLRTSELAQWIRAFTTKPDNLNVILWVHKVEENWLL